LDTVERASCPPPVNLKTTIACQATQGSLPGRNIENQWRFLKSAIDDWLRTPSSHAALLQQIGALADDETLTELRASIYRDRGRSEVDEGQDA
jgi:hypothetical protein